MDKNDLLKEPIRMEINSDWASEEQKIWNCVEKLDQLAQSKTKKLGEKVKSMSFLNAVDKNGDTPLTWAAQSNVALVYQLLNHKEININQKNQNGDTGLMVACKHNPEAVPEFVLHPEVDVNIKNNNNEKAIDLLKQNNPESHEQFKHLFYKNESRLGHRFDHYEHGNYDYWQAKNNKRKNKLN